jgi:hypothetical protein
METVTFNGTKIALIVRGKLNTNRDPDLMAQHADVILPDGSPIGFFGKGDGLSVGRLNLQIFFAQFLDHA